MVLTRRDATFMRNFYFTVMLKLTYFIGLDIWNYLNVKSGHDLTYDSVLKKLSYTPLFSYFSVCAFCGNHPKTTPKYLLFEKIRYAYKNHFSVVNAVTFYRTTVIKLRIAQKIVASLYAKPIYFLLIFVHVFHVKNDWQRTQWDKKHPVDSKKRRARVFSS